MKACGEKPSLNETTEGKERRAAGGWREGRGWEMFTGTWDGDGSFVEDGVVSGGGGRGLF